MEGIIKNILHIILISFFCLTFISCAKESGSSSSSTTTTMSTPSIADGNYKMSAYVMKIYYKSSGNLAQNVFIVISHDSTVTPGYLGYGMEWKGSGVYRMTVFGKGTLIVSGTDVPMDCSTNQIWDVTLDENGSSIGPEGLLIQTGCGGSSTSATLVSDKYTPISGGFIKEGVMEDNTYRYDAKITLLKQ